MSDIYTHFSHKLGLIRNLFFINKKEFTIINFLLTFQVFESKLQFVARYFSLWILRTRHSWNVGFEFQRFTKHWCLPIWQSEMACWPEGNYWNSKLHIFWEGHKILRNLHLTFSHVVSVKSKVEISQNFVAFSEYMN